MLSLAKSAMLRRSLEQILALPFASPNPFVLTQMESPEFQGLILGQEHHRAILDAVENREGARAEALAREHARLARRNLNAALQTPGLSSVSSAPLIKFPEAVDRIRSQC
jgi:GntR family transcriptional regulator, vanillate catabolism transcriptional regulator